MKSSLLQKRFVLVLSVQAVLLLLLWFQYHKAAVGNLDTLVKENTFLVTQALMDEIGSEFDHMKTVCDAIAGSSYIQDFLQERDIHTFYNKAVAVSEIVDKAAFPVSSSDSIVVINNQGDFYRFTGGLSNEACRRLYEQFQGEKNAYTIVELDQSLYFCHSNTVLSSDSRQTTPIGNVLMLTAVSKTRRVLERGGEDSGDMVVLTDGRVLLSSLPFLEGKDKAELESLYGEVLFEDLRHTGLEIGALYQKNPVSQEKRLFLGLSLAMAGLTLLTLLIIYGYLYHDMVLPMSGILQNVSTIGDGSGRLPLTGRREFDRLVDGINHMLERTQRYHMGLMGRQINTHFIVNTLIHIKNLAEHGDSTKASLVALELSKLIKHMQAGDRFINIFLEVEFVENYVLLMNIKHDDQFFLETELDERLAEYCMPGFILQPIVENALVHGLSLKEQDCHLTLTGFCTVDDIRLQVADNGIGMSEIQLAQQQQTLQHAHEGELHESGMHGMALYNIQRRLKTLYGEPYGLILESTPGVGTVVTVVLPFVEDW